MSGAKSDAGDAHMLADMVRTDSHQLRAVAGDSAEAEGVKVLARTHKTLIWERTRHVQRLRHQLREYFPAALEAYDDLDAPDTLELLGKAPEPARAARLTRAQVSAALKRARRRNIADKATAILAALRSPQLGQPPAVTAAYAATVRSLIAVITVLSSATAASSSRRWISSRLSGAPAASRAISRPVSRLVASAIPRASSAAARRPSSARSFSFRSCCAVAWAARLRRRTLPFGSVSVATASRASSAALFAFSARASARVASRSTSACSAASPSIAVQ